MTLKQLCNCDSSSNFCIIVSVQVRGTVFNELDDDKLHSLIDFTDFEERFKLGVGPALAAGDSSETDGLTAFPSKRFKKPENVSLLEHTRLRNIGMLSLAHYFLFVFLLYKVSVVQIFFYGSSHIPP